MDKLTEEQAEQVDRLLRLYYAQGIAVAAKHMAEAFDTLGVTLETAVKAIQELTAEVIDINSKDTAEYGN